MSTHRKQMTGFTLMELLVVIAIIALLMGILLPALSKARQLAQKLKTSSQQRNVQNSLVAFSGDNNDWFPGVNQSGQFVNYSYDTDNQSSGTPNSAAPYDTPVIAMWYLLKESYMPPRELVSPADADVATYTGNFPTGNVDGGNPDNVFKASNYSYSLLATGDRNAGNTAYTHATWRSLWRNNANSQLPVVCDRAFPTGTGSNPYEYTSSIWSNPKTDLETWDGYVVWNDGHVTWEQKPEVPTRVSEDGTDPTDRLFIGDDGAAGDNTDNILMSHSDGESPA